MELIYKNNKLEKTLTNKKEIVKAYGQRAKKIKQRLDDLKAAGSLYDLTLIPQANFHILKGSKRNEFAVDVSKNFRLVFVSAIMPLPLTDQNSIDLKIIDKVKIINIKDYH